MSEAKMPETTQGNSPPLSVEAKVFPYKKEGNLLAFASVTLGGCFAVRDIRVMNSEKGVFLSMPDRPDGKGEYRDICFPTTAEMRTAIKTAVLNEYQKVMELMAERGAEAKTSVHNALHAPPKKEPPAQETAKPAKQRKADKGAR